MRAVIQRVSRAEVKIGEEAVGKIGKGLLVLLGAGREDTEKDVSYLAGKVAGLRIFEDEQGKMNLSIKDIEGEALCVSQFTLYGDARKGKRPGFTAAAPPEEAERLYLLFCQELQELGVKVATGRFQEEMEVELVNQGPVTLLLDSQKNF